MPVITIREEEKTDTGFEVTLRFEEEEYSLTITNPFTSKEEQELEWYFEEWLEFPFSDTIIAERAAVSINTKRLWKCMMPLEVNKTDKNNFGKLSPTTSWE